MKSRRLQSPAFSLTKVWEHAIKTVISKAFFGGLVAMLVVAKSLREIAFGKLMDVYQEGNLENGADRWPDEPEGRQIALAEEDFYNYLQQVFFNIVFYIYNTNIILFYVISKYFGKKNNYYLDYLCNKSKFESLLCCDKPIFLFLI